MTLQLADRSITRPYGVIKDVLVKVKHLIFLADFVVVYIKEDVDIPLILGRPFMSTVSCVVDMGKKMLWMGIEDQKINFDLFHENKDLPDQNVCLKVHVMEERRPERKGPWSGNLLGSWITGWCVKLVILKERLLGGNPAFLSLFYFSFVSLACS